MTRDEYEEFLAKRVDEIIDNLNDYRKQTDDNILTLDKEIETIKKEYKTVLQTEVEYVEYLETELNDYRKEIMERRRIIQDLFKETCELRKEIERLKEKYEK